MISHENIHSKVLSKLRTSLLSCLGHVWKNILKLWKITDDYFKIVKSRINQSYLNMFSNFYYFYEISQIHKSKLFNNDLAINNLDLK